MRAHASLLRFTSSHSPSNTSSPAARIEEEKLPRAAYEWYLDLRKYGTFTHAGFGLGLERTVAWICGIQHVREVIAFPRMMHRLTP